MAITPATMVSITPLKLFAKANVQPAHDEKQNHNSDEKQIQHSIYFKFVPKRHSRNPSLEALITLPLVRANSEIS
jgi:hypothetical protein